MYRTDDMLAIFFPHLFEDIEYLVPSEEVVMDTAESQPTYNDGGSGSRFENAVAGPSRLH